MLDRLAPSAGERILDIGSGTGRLASEITARAPSAHVVGIDRSWSMLTESRRQFPKLAVVRAEAARIPFIDGFDAVCSTATFHWIPDHTTLFAEVHRVLVPGGRLVAQAGGGPNLARLHDRAAKLAQSEYASAFAGWQDPWTFAGVEVTRARLRSAGFANCEVWLEEAPTTFNSADDFSEFVSTVCLRHHLERLEGADQAGFVRGLAAQASTDDPPFTLDYWRLNIDARKG